MKRTLAIGTMVLIAGTLLAADTTPKDEITAAAKKLGDATSYAWHSETVVPEGTRFRPGPIDGKIEKGGFSHISWSFGDNTVEIVRKGDKAAYTDRDGVWQLADEQAENGPGRWMSSFARTMPIPSTQAAELAKDSTGLKKEGDVYTSDLTEEGAKSLMSFRRGNGGPTISNAKGSVKFWLKDGQLSKYEYKVTGQMNWNGNDVDIDRDTTVEIKGVGSTKVDVPEGAKKKLES